LERRRVLLNEQSLEISRGSFHRLVVFESVRHLRLRRTKGGRLVSLTLELEDDAVTLRDVERLKDVVEAAAQGRPEKALLEIEEVGVDWGEPQPWTLLCLGLGALALVAVFSGRFFA
jgi:hypothetical protein